MEALVKSYWPMCDHDLRFICKTPFFFLFLCFINKTNITITKPITEIEPIAIPVAGKAGSKGLSGLLFLVIQNASVAHFS
jgi:hypothetical protein